MPFFPTLRSLALPVLLSALALCQQAHAQDRDEERADAGSGLRGVIEPDDAESGPDGADAPARLGDADGEHPDPDAAMVAVPQERTAVAEARDNGYGPYDPPGVRIGSFLLFPQMHVETLFTDNVIRSATNPRSDIGLVLTPGLELHSGWSRHSLEAAVTATRIDYREFSEENEAGYDAELRGRIDVTRRTNVEAEAEYSLAQEARGSVDLPANVAGRPDVRTSAVALKANHRFNRLTLSLRGALSKEDYDDAILNSGAIVNNDDRDFTERKATARAAYELQPGVSVFVEGSKNDRTFDSRFDDNGLGRDSDGYEAQGGLSLRIGGKVTGEVSAGYARQTPDERLFSVIEGPVYNAGLIWRATALTTVRFDAESRIEETTLIDSAGALQRTARLSVEHALRHNLLLGASFAYSEEDYAGSSLERREYAFGPTAEYLFNRSLALTARYEHLVFTSNVPGEDYTVDTVRVGLRVRR